MLGARRLAASIIASAAVHALALGVLIHAEHGTLRPPLVAIPIGLVAGRGGGGGDASAPTPAPTSEPPAATPPAAVRPAPVPRRAIRPLPAATGEAAASRPAERASATGSAEQGGSAEAAGGGRGGAGGAGGAGDGVAGARVAYGTNPLPPYPLVARRLGKEGVVLLEVVVAADGRAADVRVRESSGFAPLDESAASTVRERWRFLPARRDGVPVESRVTVPIRFRLEDDRG
jgi:periplasmic protein TonB